MSISPHTVARPHSPTPAVPPNFKDGGAARFSKRPPIWLSLGIDATLTIGAGIAAYWFGANVTGFETRLPALSPLLPPLAAAQLMTLAMLQGLVRRSPIGWLLRVSGGVVGGTALACVGIVLWWGPRALSPLVLVDMVLLGGAVVAWRTVWMLVARAQARARTRVDATMIDRSEELMTLRGIALSIYAYRELLKNLVWKDVKLKYRGSVFGFLWSLANPLLMIVVYSIAFTFILRIRAPGFVFHLMLGQLAWTFFANSAAMSTGAIIDNAGLLKSVIFPRAILPIGTVLFNLVQFLLTLAVFLPVMMLWYRVPVNPTMLAFPLILGLQVVFTSGVALTLAAATAFFRDIRHLLEVALAVLFWTTPILYALSQVPERLQPLILLSPVASYVVAYQQIFVHQAWPDAAVWLVTIAYALGAFAVGALLFVTFEDRFTEQL